VSVVPGAIYGASGIFTALMGGGYRDLWVTSMEVPVADLSTLGGGLTPNRLGGGMTTQTLHLDGADGRRYVFRSVHKTPRELLEDFEGSALEGIIQDQMSSFHPTGAPVVARLLDAVEVLHPEPVFMVVPDDPRLGEFRKQFAGLLVLVEERPDDGPDGGPGFGGSRKIVQTDALFDLLEEDPANRVAAEELLRARLIDLLVGDRDRSHNNHLWARYDAGDGGFVWRVIPRDRDQAFVRFDGIFKALARHYDRRLITFQEAFPDIYGLTRNAWDIDRNLLVGLDRDQWDHTVQGVVGALTDQVIDEAVDRMPREHVAVIGDEMRDALRRRRDHLPEAAAVLYGIVSGVADIHGTDAAEGLRVAWDPVGNVSVTLTPREGGSTPTFQRTFIVGETSEIRIYLHGGDDEAVLEGEGADGIRVRVIGGGGHDRFVDRTGRSHAVLYDGDADTDFPGAGDARVRRRAALRPFSWFNETRTLDWGSLARPEPTASYDVDRGLVLAPGLEYDRYGFLKSPYRDRIQIRAGWAFGLQEPILDYRHLVRDVVGGGDFRLRFRWSGMEVLNFYGFGNETATDRPLAYHRVAHKQVTATAAVSVGDGERRYLEIGPTFTYTSTDTMEATGATGSSTFLADHDPYGAGKFAFAGVRLSFGVDHGDRPGTPGRGYRLRGGASFYPSLFDLTEGAFGEIHGRVAAYVSPPGGNPTLAVSAAGRKVWGPEPFTEAAFLGGPHSVRGLREQRYAGDASVLGSAELRVAVARIVFPILSDIGLFTLTDIGRVSVGGERSDRWHTGVGGGLWMALLNRSNLLRIALVRAEGRTGVDAGFGFAY